MGALPVNTPSLWAALGIGLIVAVVVFWASWQQHALRRERKRSMDAARRADAMLNSVPGAYIAWEAGGRFICSPKVKAWLDLKGPITTLIYGVAWTGLNRWMWTTALG